jgi:tubulin alpha
MREIISCHVGGAGISIGESVWKILADEYTNKGDSFFAENSAEQIIPRAIFIDNEPEALNSILKSSLFSETQVSLSYMIYLPKFKCIRGKESTGGVYGAGFYGNKYPILESTMESIRKIAEECSGIQVHNSYISNMITLRRDSSYFTQ